MKGEMGSKACVGKAGGRGRKCDIFKHLLGPRLENLRCLMVQRGQRCTCQGRRYSEHDGRGQKHFFLQLLQAFSVRLVECLLPFRSLSPLFPDCPAVWSRALCSFLTVQESIRQFGKRQTAQAKLPEQTDGCLPRVRRNWEISRLWEFGADRSPILLFARPTTALGRDRDTIGTPPSQPPEPWTLLQ